MNLIWIVLDSLRADRAGWLGSARPTTPNLDRLARECAIFEQAISPHIPTQPAHATFFTGRDVFSHQIVSQGGLHELDPAIPLLPAILKLDGYASAAVDNIGRWFEPAFDRYIPYPRWDHDGSRPWNSGEEVTSRALPLIREMAGASPFFLFLHYWDPHSPYLPPAPFDRMFYSGDERDPGHTSMDPVWRSPWFSSYFREWLDGVRDIEFVKAQYDASVAYLDHCLARLFSALDQHDLWRDSLVVIHADHGEELDDHGCWFDHHGLYETVVRVPLLIRFPCGMAAGERIADVVSLLDLLPTCCDYLGAGMEALDPAGRSLMPLLRGSRLPDSQGLYLTECTWMRKRAWRTPRRKLIQAIEPDIYGRPPLELYDLELDPGERCNLASERPAEASLLLARMQEHVSRRLRLTGRPDPLIEQADALRTWQPRFIAGRSA